MITVIIMIMIIPIYLCIGYLEEGGLAALAHRVQSILVEASGRRYRRVVVLALPAVHGPVVIAVVVDVAVAVVRQAVLALLLSQDPVLTL